MKLTLTIEVTTDLGSPGVLIGHAIEAVADLVEVMNPLVDGVLPDRLSGETKASWTLTPPAIPAYKPEQWNFILTVNVHDDLDRHSQRVATIMRAVAPIIERMNPLTAGQFNDRLSGETLASWLAGIPKGPPLIETYGPNPGPVGEGDVGFNLTGNYFATDTELYLDGEPVKDTYVYSTWTITGNMVKQKAPCTAKAMLVTGGLGYCHWDWKFSNEPTLNALDPNPVELAASANVELLLNGANFTEASQPVVAGNAAVAKEFVSATQLKATFVGPNTTTNWAVLVRTPDFPDTATIQWAVTVVTPLTLTSLDPNPVVVGEDTLTCIGTGFTVDSDVVVDGALAAATQFNSATEIMGIMASAPALGAHPVLVRDAGVDTAPIDWVIEEPPIVPVLTSLVPNPTVAEASTVTLDALGTDFEAASVIINGSATCVTEFISSTNLRTTIARSLNPATIPVLIRTPGKPDTAPIDWVFTAPPPPPPVLTSIEPDPTGVATAPAPLGVLACIGSGFTAASVIYMAGMVMVTRFVSATRLETDTVSSTAAGSWPVFVRTPGFPDTATIDWTFDAGPPTLISIEPNPTAAGGPIAQLICHGTGFTETSGIVMNDVDMTTLFVNHTRLETTTSMKPEPGIWKVFVWQPGSDNTVLIDWVFE
jgi:hypothetical protein